MSAPVLLQLQKRWRVSTVCITSLFSGLLLCGFACQRQPAVQGEGQIAASAPAIVQAPSNDSIAYADAPKVITRNIIQVQDGTIWLATFEGMIRYDGHTFTNMTRAITPARFFGVLEDSKGHVWGTSIGAGIWRYDGDTWQQFSTENGLVNDRVTNVYEDTEGVLWIGTEGGISCYDGEGFRSLTKQEGLPNEDVNDILQDTTGQYWIATRGYTFTYDGTAFTMLVNPIGSGFGNIRQLLKDSKGNIWLGGKDGLWRYDGHSFQNVSMDFVGNMHEDRSGQIWVSAESRMFQGWSLIRYEAVDLPGALPKPNFILTGEGMLFGILEDAAGHIWVGHLGGVYCYNGEEVEDFKQ